MSGIAVLSFGQEETLTALRAFLLGILPANVEVIQAQDNRVPEPEEPDFVTMTPTLRRRLSTNVDVTADAVFTGSISGNILTITHVYYGTLEVGRMIFGAGVTEGTRIQAFQSGAGGLGTYTVDKSQTVSSETIAAGTETLLQSVEITVQLDVHGPNSADNVHIIATAFRDSYAVDQFATSGVDVVPLYMNDPKQLPFVNAEQQVENRWVADAVMQGNPVVTIPFQFADTLALGVIDVEVTYPPS